MGKSNYYDKMKWQDSIKVIITQKLHQIRNWEFHNMLYGMSTIEMIENLKIENLTENRWYDGSDDRQRFVFQFHKIREYFQINGNMSVIFFFFSRLWKIVTSTIHVIQIDTFLQWRITVSSIFCQDGMKCVQFCTYGKECFCWYVVGL